MIAGSIVFFSIRKKLSERAHLIHISGTPAIMNLFGLHQAILGSYRCTPRFRVRVPVYRLSSQELYRLACSECTKKPEVEVR